MEYEGIRPGVFAEVIDVLLRTKSRQAIKYLSENLVVKATRKSYGGRPPRKDEKQETLLVTVGRPNYKEREFIQLATRLGEPFPIRRCQLRGFPGRKVA